MIIIGEKLNSPIPNTLEKINNKDKDALVSLIKLQKENGANFLDINTSICRDDELENMIWLINLCIENSDCGIMIDTPNVEVVKEAIKHVKDRPVIINSVTLVDRLYELIPTIKEYNASVVCLPIDKAGVPKESETRFENAVKIIEILNSNGISNDKIYIDILIESLAIDAENVMVSIDTVKKLKQIEGIKTVCGLSNVSFGLPKRKIINAYFLCTLIGAGLDSAIVDINSVDIRDALYTSNLINGKDEYCMEYIGYIRSSKD